MEKNIEKYKAEVIELLKSYGAGDKFIKGVVTPEAIETALKNDRPSEALAWSLIL